MASQTCSLLRASTSTWEAPTDGFDACVRGEGAGFVGARMAAYRHCSNELNEHVSVALDKLNERVLGEISMFLRSGTKQVQRDTSAPPYVELPAAFVHTCCHSADLPLALREVKRHLRATCSPHMAVLHSKECGTLVSATRSLVAQLIGPTARTAPGCSFDLGVLAGWHADLCAGRVAARAAVGGGHRRRAAAAAAVVVARDDALVVVVEDAEHFAPDVLNDLIYSCASVRSADGAPLPICLVFALAAGVEGLQRLLHRSSLILIRGCRFALAGTDRSVDAIVGRLLCSTAFPELGGLSYAYLLGALEQQHGSTTAFVRQLHWLLLRHVRREPLAFLVSIEPFAHPLRGSMAVKAAEQTMHHLSRTLGAAQLHALHALPSVAAALADDPPTGGGPRGMDTPSASGSPAGSARSRARVAAAPPRSAASEPPGGRLPRRQPHEHVAAAAARAGDRDAVAPQHARGRPRPRKVPRARPRRALARAPPRPPPHLPRAPPRRRPRDRGAPAQWGAGVARCAHRGKPRDAGEEAAAPAAAAAAAAAPPPGSGASGVVAASGVWWAAARRSRVRATSAAAPAAGRGRALPRHSGAALHRCGGAGEAAPHDAVRTHHRRQLRGGRRRRRRRRRR